MKKLCNRFKFLSISIKALPLKNVIENWKISSKANLIASVSILYKKEEKWKLHSSQDFSTKVMYFEKYFLKKKFHEKIVRINKTNLWIFSQDVPPFRLFQDLSYNWNWIWMECINPSKRNYTKSCQMKIFFLCIYMLD